MGTECASSATITIDQWSDVFASLDERIARRFVRTEVRERLRRYLIGLLDRVERKNGWQLAEVIGDADPQGVQRLVRTAHWDTEAVRDDLCDYILAHLGDEASGILIVDETGFLKKGRKSCGVARQYTGTAGDTVNAHATQRVPGRLPRLCLRTRCSLHRPRPLPAAGVDKGRDQRRRVEAGIPKTVRFATKIALAQRMLTRAFAAAAPARWVVADSGYGRSHRFRQ